MHEMSYCIKIVDEAIRAAKDNNLSTVSEIVVSVGKMTGCVDELLLNAFEAAKKNTILSNATLTLVSQEVVASCLDCNKDYVPSREFNYACPICKGFNSKIIKGRNCTILKLIGD